MFDETLIAAQTSASIHAALGEAIAGNMQLTVRLNVAIQLVGDFTLRNGALKNRVAEQDNVISQLQAQVSPERKFNRKVK